MKVFHICSDYIGVELYQKFIEALQRKNIYNQVYTATTIHEPCIVKLDDYVDVSICIKKYDRLFYRYKNRKILKDVLSKYSIDKYDMLHAHTLYVNGYVAYKLYKKFGIPYIVTVRNTDLNIFYKYMIHLRGIGLKILYNANKIILLSEAYKDNLVYDYIPEKNRREIKLKCIVIPNGIDKYWFEFIGNQKFKINKKKINLVYAGIINKNKNIVTTVKACKLLMLKGYDISFTIVGKIQDKNIYKKIIKNNFIKYIGPQLKEDLREIFNINDIFIMPSIAETFGLVYVEAMSQGLPVIYSRGQGFDRQFEEGEVGYNVNCYDYHEVADRILDILKNYENISFKCIDMCSKFDWDSIADRYIDIYLENH